MKITIEDTKKDVYSQDVTISVPHDGLVCGDVIEIIMNALLAKGYAKKSIINAFEEMVESYEIANEKETNENDISL